MSVQAIFWATQQKLPAMQKIVLVMIANRLNQTSGACFPSLDTLAKDCGMSRRAVINQIAKLESAHLLSVARSDNKCAKQNNNYQLPTSAASVPYSPAVHPMHGGSEPDDSEIVNKVHSKQDNINNKLTTTEVSSRKTSPSSLPDHLETKACNPYKQTKHSSGSCVSKNPTTSNKLCDISSPTTEASTPCDTTLIFPSSFNPEETKAAMNILRFVAVNDQQPMLDVLIATIDANEIRKSSIACLGGIARRYRDGTFDASSGDKVRSRRKQQVLTQKRTAAIDTVNHSQVMDQLAALAKPKQKPQQLPQKHALPIRELTHIRSLLSLK